jgi:hypothetical protein
MIGTQHQLLQALRPLGYLKVGYTNIKANCPRCEKSGSPKDKFNLEISYNKNRVHCWACNYKGSLNKVIKDFGYPEYANLFRSKQWVSFDEKEEKPVFELPREVFNVLNHPVATEYLLSRGLTKQKIRERDVKFCYGGDYKDYIIFPSYNTKGQLTRFELHNLHTKKYKTEKSDIHVCFYESFIDKRAPIIITEGVYDALVVPNAIPLMGLYSLSKDFLNFISDCDIILALDNDVKPEVLKSYLKDLGSVCRSVVVFNIPKPSKDLNDMFRYNLLVLEDNLKQFYTSKELIEANA